MVARLRPDVVAIFHKLVILVFQYMHVYCFYDIMDPSLGYAEQLLDVTLYQDSGRGAHHGHFGLVFNYTILQMSGR